MPSLSVSTSNSVLIDADGGIADGEVLGGTDEGADKAAVVVTPSTVKATRLSYAQVDVLLRQKAGQSQGERAAEVRALDGWDDLAPDEQRALLAATTRAPVVVD